MALPQKEIIKKGKFKYKAIIFDFDGVILESVDIKTEAFRELFQNFPDKVEKIVKYHIENTGVSRYEKFRYIYNKILNKPISEVEISELGRRFSEIVYRHILKCPFVEGALPFLKKYYNIFDMYIVSATPIEEIRDIVKKRNLNKYFKAVYGSPVSKSKWVKTIISDGRYERHEVIYIGDAITDYKAAIENEIPFIGRKSSKNNIFNGLNIVAVVEDLRDIERYLI